MLPEILFDRKEDFWNHSWWQRNVEYHKESYFYYIKLFGIHLYVVCFLNDVVADDVISSLLYVVCFNSMTSSLLTSFPRDYTSSVISSSYCSRHRSSRLLLMTSLWIVCSMEYKTITAHQWEPSSSDFNDRARGCVRKFCGITVCSVGVLPRWISRTGARD